MGISNLAKYRYRHSPHGRAKRSEWSTNKAHRVRRAWIEAQGRRCARCGITTPDTDPYPAAFWHVDHIDPTTKVFRPCAVWHRRKEVREYELQKCQLLCAPCHFWKTTRDGSHEHLWMHFDRELIKRFREPGDEEPFENQEGIDAVL